MSSNIVDSVVVPALVVAIAAGYTYSAYWAFRVREALFDRLPHAGDRCETQRCCRQQQRNRPAECLLPCTIHLYKSTAAAAS